MGELYDRLCSMENLLLAYRKASKGKSKKWYVIKFRENLEQELAKIKSELENCNYKPRPLKRFIIRDPKTRVIHASVFRDRVVHHAICNILEPIFDKTFIYDSVANRKGKGAHAALKRFDEFKRKVSKNGRLVKRAKYSNMVIGYFLKADIRHYFPNVDHDILLSILGRKVTDENVLMLITTILKENAPEGRGMPIGNMTSQFFANLYLNELDQFVKHQLRAKYYLRYVDDFVILHRDRHVLEGYKQQIAAFLNILKLELHPEKSMIGPLHKGIKLLGYRMFYYHSLLRKSSTAKMKRKLSGLKRSDIDKVLIGWNGYAMWANTFKLRRNIIENVLEIVP
ncbi:MAG TPA: reverse transcriptase domain-containing protein [archaeon]|nr:reverse transcriptase domain-containing protein [archaeon]